MVETLSGLNHWQIDLVVVGLLLEGAVFAILPEELIIMTLGLLWGRGRVGFIESLLSVQVGLLSANLVMVLIGQRVGGLRFLKKKSVGTALDFLRRYGDGLIFVTRFTPIVRAPVYLSVGISRFGILRFFRVDAFASFLQIPLLLLLGRQVGSRNGSFSEALATIGIYAGSFFGFFVLMIGAIEVRRRFKRSVSCP